MKLVESILKKYGEDKLKVLNSVANETDSEVDINELAYNLFYEIRAYIYNNIPTDCKYWLSFIGYSMGGIIIRATIPLLKDYH